MAFLLDDALMIGSLLLNLGGNILSKPKKRRFDAAKIFAPIKQGILENTEAVTAPIRQTAGESAAARGLSGGAGAQVAAQADAPVRAAATSDLNRIFANLKMQEEESRYGDIQAQRDWWGKTFGDVAGGASTWAGYKLFSKMLSENNGTTDAGGWDKKATPGESGDSIYQASAVPRSRPDLFSDDKLLSVLSSPTNYVSAPPVNMFRNRKAPARSNAAGGYNPFANLFFPRWKRGNQNQWTSPNPYATDNYTLWS